MNDMDYWAFRRKNGRSLAEINPNSDEIALTITDTLVAINLLLKEQIPILGADVLLECEGSLEYLYQILGDEYIYLNWYCDELDYENREEYIQKSHNIAKEYINNIANIEKKYNIQCYIVLVVGDAQT